MRCELYANEGVEGGNYYDSLQQIEADEEMGYEEMMELRDQVGVVSVGYDEDAIKKIKVDSYVREGD